MEPTPPSLPAVVLVRPREEGNVGSAARAMANMGLDRMILVEPAAVLGEIALAFAVGARQILKDVTRVSSIEAALEPFSRVIGTSSARDRRLGIPLLTPRELPAFLAADPPGTPTALVFGPEVGGLTNAELSLASAVVVAPTAPALPTLNLAQAVLLVTYELHLASGMAPDLPPVELDLAPSAQVDGLFAQFDAILKRVGFDRDSSYGGVLRDLRSLASRSALNAREVGILRGICRRVARGLGAEPL